MTELKITDALKLGVEAHKAGKIQEADRYYTAILKVQPNHPDANHNLGILAVSVNKVGQAIPLLKKALETNPKIPQFWLSFIKALLKDKQLDAAQKAIIQAKSHGVDKQSLQKFQSQLTQINNQTSIKDNLENIPNTDELKNLINLHKNGETEKALKRTEIMLKQFPESALLFNISGACHFSAKNYEAAIESYKRAINLRPDYADAHNNIANVYKKMNMDSQAFSYYKKCIKLDPKHKDAYNNLGLFSIKIGKFDDGVFYFESSLHLDTNQIQAQIGKGHCHRKLNELEEALICFERALKIDGQNFEVFLNLASMYTKMGKFELAVENYAKTLNLEPNHVAGQYNFGNCLNRLGNFDGAIEAYKKSLEIDPLYIQAWNALYFPIISKQHPPLLDDLLGSISCNKENRDDFNRLKAVANYRIHAGSSLADKYFEQATHLCKTATDDLLINPNRKKKPSLLTENNYGRKKTIALAHFGRSGTGLFHSLIDGHSSVSTLPSIYFSEFFEPTNWKKIISGGWDNAIEKFMRTYDVLFDANSLVPIQSRSGKLYSIGKKEGMANLGLDKNEVFTVDKALFKKELKRLLSQYTNITSFDFFHLVHTAYDFSIGDTADKKVLFYHIHNPSTAALINFSQFSSDINWVMMVREPIQCCESWLAKPFSENDFYNVVDRIQLMFLEIDNIVYSKQNAVGVKLEELKNNPHKILPKFCKWMGIEEEASLYEMSAQGKRWWGDPSSRDFEKDGMEPFGKTSITRKVGTIFSERDQFILQTLFYPFSLRFGYVTEDTAKFTSDLDNIKPMLSELFDFEHEMVKIKKMSKKEYMSSSPFHLLRATLREKWDTLKTYGTYRHMITPLR